MWETLRLRKKQNHKWIDNKEQDNDETEGFIASFYVDFLATLILWISEQTVIYRTSWITISQTCGTIEDAAVLSTLHDESYCWLSSST